MRKQFHAQLQYLWHTQRFLMEGHASPREYGLTVEQELLDSGGYIPLLEAVARSHALEGYRFVPLVREAWSLVCELDIILLRHDGPGSFINGGDVDNRVKTLVDALTIPTANQLDGGGPGRGEDPFFCLLEDDKLVSRLNVETDRLLRQPEGTKRPEHVQHVEALITVTVRPSHMTVFNLAFG